MTDLQLWQKMKSGDSAALKEIYDQEAASLLSYAKRLGAGKEIAQDCLHDLFVYIWNRRANLTDTDSIGRYLAVALRRRVIKKLQEDQRKIDLESCGHFASSFTTDSSLTENESKAELTDQIKRAFKHLTDRQQEVLYLKFFKNMGYEDIAVVMDINYQSVRNLMYGGLQKLRKHSDLLRILLIFCLLRVQNELWSLIYSNVA